MKDGKKNQILSLILGGIAAILCIATLVLLFESTVLGTVYLRTSGNPEEIICYFYECIESGKFSDAYSFLAEYSDLGLESSEMESRYLNDALKKSYECHITKDLQVDGLTAKAEVEFTYLDLAKLQEKVQNGINPVLEGYIEKLSREELYDENGDYKQEFLQMVYDEVLKDVIEMNKDIYNTSVYQVDMQYTDDGWKILTNKEMIKCFLGGKNA